MHESFIYLRWIILFIYTSNKNEQNINATCLLIWKNIILFIIKNRIKLLHKVCIKKKKNEMGKLLYYKIFELYYNN